MSENRRQILEMLCDGKIKIDEAERLLSAVEVPANPPAGAGTAKHRPRYLCVIGDSYDTKGEPVKVNVRVPMQLLRAGVRLTALMTPQVSEAVAAEMRAKGVDIDLRQIKPENLDDLVDSLSELRVDVNSETKSKMRVYCE
jgi:hypothetical protein